MQTKIDSCSERAVPYAAFLDNPYLLLLSEQRFLQLISKSVEFRFLDDEIFAHSLFFLLLKDCLRTSLSATIKSDTSDWRPAKTMQVKKMLL